MKLLKLYFSLSLLFVTSLAFGQSANRYVAPTVYTSSTTLQLTDANTKFVLIDNATPQTVSIPTDAAVAFPIGSFIPIMGEDTLITIAAVSPGTTTLVFPYGGLDHTSGKLIAAVAWKRAANLWWILGTQPGGGSNVVLYTTTGTNTDGAMDQNSTTTALATKAVTTRNINTTSPLSGGGNLSADRTLTIADAAADGTTKGAASFTAADFDATSGNIAIDYTNGQTANGSTKGFLSAADWTTFNNAAGAVGWLVTGNTLSTTGELGANSAHGINIKTNNITRHAISSTGEHTFTQSIQAGTNTAFTFTQAAHTAGAPTAFTINAGAHTGLTASTPVTDILFNLQRTLTRASGAITNDIAVSIPGRTLAFSGGSTVTRSATVAISPPIAGTNATITNAEALSLSGRLYINQGALTSAHGIFIDNSGAGGLNLYLSPDVNFAVTSGLNLNITGTAQHNLTAANILYRGNGTVTTSHAFSNSAAYSTAGKIFIGGVATWTNPGAGNHIYQQHQINWAENGSVASNYTGFDGVGTINLVAGNTGTLYLQRFHPTVTSLGGITPYGFVIDDARFKSGIGTSTPTSTLSVNGSFSTAYVDKTALYTLTDTDGTVEVTSGTHTQTLPTAVGITGRQYVITNSGSGVVTVGTTSSQTFVNVATTPTTLTLAQFDTAIVQSNGANWLRLK